MRKQIKSWLQKLFYLLPFLVLAGCTRQERMEEGSGALSIHYLNKAETAVVSQEVNIEEEDPEELLQILLEQLQQSPQDTGLRAAIVESMGFEEAVLKDGTLTVSFGKGYSQLPPTTEVLTRAAIIRTVCQLKEVVYVNFVIDGSALLDVSGNPVGVMTAEQFLDNAGNEINTYETVQLKLYFANETGEKLVESYQEAEYNSNISLEKLVVEKIIAGPDEEDAFGYATINPDTKVLSVTVKDKVCYVNLSSAFQTQIDNVSAEVMVYSLVNSLAELNNVNKVQISIDGKADVIIKESVSLSSALERNLGVIEE